MKKQYAFILFLILIPFVSFAQTTETGSDLTPKVSSLTHPDQARWYKSNTVELEWDRPAGAFGFSFVLDQKPETIPDSTLDTTITQHKTYADLDDGTWYFHIKARKQAKGTFGNTVNFKIGIDTQPPSFPRISVDDNANFIFSSTDDVSGISRYDLKIDNQGPIANITSPYRLDNLAAGQHDLMITAFDAAGNSADSITTYEAPVPSNRSINLMNRPVTFPLYIFLLGAVGLFLVLIGMFIGVIKKPRREEKPPVAHIFADEIVLKEPIVEDQAIVIPVKRKVRKVSAKPAKRKPKITVQKPKEG